VLLEYCGREEQSWLELAGLKYSYALADFVTSPLDENVSKRVLKCGRHYSQICSEQGNARLFNELALQKVVNTARQTNEALEASN
jgi:heterodisulfide reductase subunit C